MMNVSIVELEAWNDCLLLMNASNDICEAFKTAIRQEGHFARMARAARVNEPHERELLDDCRSKWNEASAEGGDHLHAKLALAIGLTGLRGLERRGLLSAAGEESLRRDAFLYRLYYTDGDDAGPRADSVRALFRALLQRSTIELHTFVANRDCIEDWIGEMGTWERELEPDIESFAAAVAGPDPAKREPQGTEAPFYSPADPLLQLLRRLRKGEDVDPSDVRSALQTEPASQYATLVADGFRQCVSASARFMEAAV